MVCKELKDHIVALRQAKQGLHRLNGNFLCFSCPSAAFALQHDGFVARDWLATKDVYRPGNHYFPFFPLYSSPQSTKFLSSASPSEPRCYVVGLVTSRNGRVWEK